MLSIQELIFLLITLTIILMIVKKYPEVRNFLIVAFLLRLIFAIIDKQNLILLPDSFSDASKFNTLAKNFSKDEGLLVIFNFFKNDSLLFPRYISIFYTIFGESKFMIQIIGAFIGTLSIYLLYLLCCMIWDKSSAKKAAWISAFFPSLILYSCLLLREVYIVFFIILGLHGIAKFMKYQSTISILQAMAGFFILVFLHGPEAIGFLVFLFFFIINTVQKQLRYIVDYRIKIYDLCLIVVLLFLLIIYFFSDFNLPYIGGIKTFFNLNKFIIKINEYLIGDASYPSWLLLNHDYEFFTKGILKIIYFLYSPFVWDLKEGFHIVGLFDGMIYFVLTIYLIKNFNAIWENPIARVFILIFITYLIIYGISIGNFGTAIRHRSKFVMILILLAAPKIQKFIFLAKKKFKY